MLNDRGAEQMKLLFLFIKADIVLEKLEIVHKDLTTRRLAFDIFDQLGSNQITLKKVKSYGEDVYMEVVYIIENYDEALNELEHMEEDFPDDELHEQKRKVNNLAHSVIDSTISQMVYKIRRGRTLDLTAVETLFAYENMGHVQKRFDRYNCCIVKKGIETIEKLRGIKG